MYRVERTIEWGDCDAAGIVFYPNFFRWMDATFHAFTRSEGFDQTSLGKDYGLAGTPLVDAGCRFLAPARFYDTISIEVTVTKLGQSSLSLDYRFFNGAQPLVKGHEARTFVSRTETGISKSEIPKPIRAKLEKHYAK